MLSFDFLQPSHDGRHLAIVRFGVEGAKPRLCDMALVRCAPEVVAQFPDFYRQLPRDLEEERAQRMPAAFYFHLVKDRDPANWRACGLTVIEHHTHIELRWARGNENARFNRVTRDLLRHPLWTAAAEAWALYGAVSTAQSGRAPTRL